MLARPALAAGRRAWRSLLAMASPSWFRLPRWLRRKPGPDVLARWRVDAGAWRDFVALERRRASDPLANDLPPRGDAPIDGVEVVVEPDALWMAGRYIVLPLRGAPEVLSAELQSPAGAPAVIELRLKYPAYATRTRVVPPRYSRVAVPVPHDHWRDARKVAAHFNRDVPGTPDFFHGRGDGSDPEDLSRCWKCGHETHKYRSECERCGASLQSRRWSRRFGFVLAFCGTVITALMGAVLYNLLPMLLQPGTDVGGARFNGGAGAAMGVLLLLGVVFAFGIAALCYGLWQVATGKRSYRVAMAMAAVGGGLFMLASLLAWFAERNG